MRGLATIQTLHRKLILATTKKKSAASWNKQGAENIIWRLAEYSTVGLFKNIKLYFLMAKTQGRAKFAVFQTNIKYISHIKTVQMIEPATGPDGSFYTDVSPLHLQLSQSGYR